MNDRKLLKLINELQDKALNNKLFRVGYGYNNGAYWAYHVLKNELGLIKKEKSK